MDAKELIERYKLGLCTAEEELLLHKWFHHLGEDEVSALSDADLSEALLQFNTEVGRTIFLTPKIFPWQRIVAAAAAVAALALCVYFFNAPKGDRHLEGSVATRDLLNDIAPGRSGATITLGNGKVIALSSEKKGVVIGDTGMMYSDGSTDPSLPTNRDRFSSRGERSVMVTAETKKGQTYEFTLPDGTKVWLNADSKISFPSQFNGKERKILLSGEGYFEVVHNAKQPFRVESNGQVVEDIGTEFNISAYGDENSVKTTLVEGSAKVTPLSALRASLPQGERGAGSVTLRPNQQAIFKSNQQATLSPLEGEMPAGQRGGNNIKVTNIDPEQAIAWKNNKFMFESQDIREIMTMIARWYNVKVVYEGPVPEDKFGGSVSRFDNISKVLNALEKTKNVHFRVEERTVYVSK